MKSKISLIYSNELNKIKTDGEIAYVVDTNQLVVYTLSGLKVIKTSDWDVILCGGDKYDNTDSGLTSGGGDKYDNTDSGLRATTIQGAIDELAGLIAGISTFLEGI